MHPELIELFLVSILPILISNKFLLYFSSSVVYYPVWDLYFFHICIALLISNIRGSATIWHAESWSVVSIGLMGFLT